MNLARALLAALGGFVAYFALGSALFALMPSLIKEFRKYPTVYRDHEGQMSHMAVGMASTFLAIVVMVVLYAQLYLSGLGAAQGAAFGGLIGLFVVFGFVFHNYVNLNVGLRLTLQNAAAYFLEWVVTGIAIGLIYKPKG
jgi:hypothetical protein